MAWTLWASNEGNLRYSLSGGVLGSWETVPFTSEWASRDHIGLYASTSTFKVYTIVSSVGLAHWDGYRWVLDYDSLGNGPYPYYRRPELGHVFCTDADDLVVATAFGPDADQILVRQGGPGSVWVTEFFGGYDGNAYFPLAVHGSPDGSAVYATVQDYNTDDMVLFRRTPGSGPVATEIFNETGISSAGEAVLRDFVVGAGNDQLVVSVSDIVAQQENMTVYMKLGAAPTDVDYDYAFVPEWETGGRFTVPNPGAGTWYVRIVCWTHWWPEESPPEGFDSLTLHADTINGVGSWTEVARLLEASKYPVWDEMQVVSATEVYIAGTTRTAAYPSGYDCARVWKWNGATLSTVFTSPLEWGDYLSDYYVDLWVSRAGSEGWLVCLGYDTVAYDYAKYVRFNGTAWSVFQECELGEYPNSVTQLAGDINSARAGYTGGMFDIFNSKGDNLWPNEYYFGYPPIENYRELWSYGGAFLRYFEGTPPIITLVVENEDPAPDEMGVEPDKVVAFDLVGDGGVVDPATVEITVAGVVAYTGETSQPGFSVTRTAIAGGYRYETSHTAPFPLYTVIKLEVYAEDTVGNPAFPSWEFTTVGTPYIAYEAPDPDATGVRRDQVVRVGVMAPDNNIDPTTVEIEIAGVVAYVSETQQPGFTVVREVYYPGYLYHITPDEEFPSSTVISVRAYAEDIVGRSVDQTWEFTTAVPILITSGILFGGEAYGASSIWRIEPGSITPDTEYVVPGSAHDFSVSPDNIERAFACGQGAGSLLYEFTNPYWTGRSVPDPPGLSFTGSPYRVHAIDENNVLFFKACPGQVWEPNRGFWLYHWDGTSFTIVKKLITVNYGEFVNAGGIHVAGPVAVVCASSGSYGNVGNIFLNTTGDFTNAADWLWVFQGFTTAHARPWAVSATEIYFTGTNVYEGGDVTHPVHMWDGAALVGFGPAVDPAGGTFGGAVLAYHAGVVWFAAHIYTPADGYALKIFYGTGGPWTEAWAMPFVWPAGYSLRDMMVSKDGTQILVVGAKYDSELINPGYTPFFVYSYDGGSNWTVYDNTLVGSGGLWYATQTAAEELAPYLDNLDPPPDATRVPRGSSVKLDVLDDGVGVDPLTVVLRLDGAIVYQAEAAEPGYTVTRSVVPTGFHYEISPDDEFATYADVLVGVYAEDTAEKVLDTSYTFKMIDYEGCVIAPINPTAGEIDVPYTSHVSLRVIDAQAVVLSSVKIELDLGSGPQLAFDGEAAEKFKPGFNGPASDLSGDPSEYVIVIDPTSDFFVGRVISVRVYALDTEGNQPILG